MKRKPPVVLLALLMAALAGAAAQIATVAFAQNPPPPPRPPGSGIEIGPDPAPPRPPTPPRAAPPSSGDPAQMDSLREQIELEQRRLEEQQERLRQMQDQLKRDRVIRPRADDEDYESDGDGEVVRMGQDLEVREGEVVSQAVALGGDVVVRGEVENDAVAIGGDVIVGSSGRVGGSAVSIGGALEIEPGGHVEGDQVEVGNLGPGFLGGAGFLNHDEAPRRGFKLMRGLLTLLVLVFIGWFAMLLFGERLSAMADMAQHSFGRSLLAGLLVLVLWLPTVVLFAITVIGIPVAIVLAVAVPLAIFVGYFIGALAFGRRIAVGINLERNGAIAQLFVGLVALGSLTLIGTLFGLVRFFGPLSLAFHILGLVMMSFAALTGLGALTMTQYGRLRFGRRGASQPPGVIQPPGASQPPAGGGEFATGPTGT